MPTKAVSLSPLPRGLHASSPPPPLPPIMPEKHPSPPTREGPDPLPSRSGPVPTQPSASFRRHLEVLLAVVLAPTQSDGIDDDLSAGKNEASGDAGDDGKCRRSSSPATPASWIGESGVPSKAEACSRHKTEIRMVMSVVP